MAGKWSYGQKGVRSDVEGKGNSAKLLNGMPQIGDRGIRRWIATAKHSSPYLEPLSPEPKNF